MNKSPNQTAGDDDKPEDRPDEPGAEGGSREKQDKLPFMPHEGDDSDAGDTDQHSDA
jgi:hypothetical protein